jgi:hypothetical protein
LYPSFLLPPDHSLRSTRFLVPCRSAFLLPSGTETVVQSRIQSNPVQSRPCLACLLSIPRLPLPPSLPAAAPRTSQTPEPRLHHQAPPDPAPLPLLTSRAARSSIMGLPLFVAPVESDIHPKPTSKYESTSPLRSSIRRSGGWRTDRSNSQRRAALRSYTAAHAQAQSQAVRDTQQDQGERPRRAYVRLFTPSQGDWSSGITNPEVRAALSEAVTMPPSFMPVDTAEPISGSSIRRERLQELLHASLRSTINSHHQPDDERTPENLGLVSLEPDGPLPVPSRITPGPRMMQPHFIHTSDGLGSQNDLTMQVLATEQALANSAAAAGHRLAPSARRFRIRAHPLNEQPSRGQAPRRGVDGLGDRERSLSPEVWDTLLSTLTPDPQPPSAGSSFASVVLSQTAGPSSTTTPSSGNATQPGEPPCDSGCENSDGEDEAYNPRENAPRHRSRRLADRVPEYNLDGPSDGPPTRVLRRNGRSASAPRASSLLPYSRHTSRERTAGLDIGAEPVSSLIHTGPREGWVGRLSVGVSDEEQGDEATRQEREGSESQNVSGGEEDLSGMQRIISNLTWRQDIPDEWWAEAGLRRTFPPDTELA